MLGFFTWMLRTELKLFMFTWKALYWLSIHIPSLPLDSCYAGNTIINQLALNISAFTPLNWLFPEATLTDASSVCSKKKKNSSPSIKKKYVFYFNMIWVHMCKGLWICHTPTCSWCISAAEDSHACRACSWQSGASTIPTLSPTSQSREKHGCCVAVFCPGSRYHDKTDE